ncbi:aldo/keto reductase [Methylocella silvestris]|nr:aldo/keto reductase [Methylocella silvestris]
MDQHKFGSSQLRVSTVGLGCSRLGSILGASPGVAARLLNLALESGVTYFDTSDLYGQGESERLLGRHVVGHARVVIATKVGKRHPLGMRLLTPFRRVATGLRGRASGVLRQARARPVPTCYEAGYLAMAINRALIRLDCPEIDVVMLHSPDAEILLNGDAVGVLEQARTAGKIRVIGASVDDLAAAEAALADPRIGALQIPLGFGERDFRAVAAKAARQGVAVVAREIFCGVPPERRDPLAMKGAICAASAIPGVSVSLVGTIHGDHLIQAIEAVSC